jgi:hypothetical protein
MQVSMVSTFGVMVFQFVPGDTHCKDHSHLLIAVQRLTQMLYYCLL